MEWILQSNQTKVTKAGVWLNKTILYQGTKYAGSRSRKEKYGPFLWEQSERDGLPGRIRGGYLSSGAGTTATGVCIKPRAANAILRLCDRRVVRSLPALPPYPAGAGLVLRTEC